MHGDERRWRWFHPHRSFGTRISLRAISVKGAHRRDLCLAVLVAVEARRDEVSVSYSGMPVTTLGTFISIESGYYHFCVCLTINHVALLFVNIIYWYIQSRWNWTGNNFFPSSSLASLFLSMDPFVRFFPPLPLICSWCRLSSPHLFVFIFFVQLFPSLHSTPLLKSNCKNKSCCVPRYLSFPPEPRSFK